VVEKTRLKMVELVGIEPPQWVENIQLADSTMFSKGRKDTNSNSALQIGTRDNQSGCCTQTQCEKFLRAYMFFSVSQLAVCAEVGEAPINSRSLNLGAHVLSITEPESTGDYGTHMRCLGMTTTLGCHGIIIEGLNRGRFSPHKGWEHR
jgi:hypothetical protein